MSLQARLSRNGWRTQTVCLHWMSYTAQTSRRSGSCPWMPDGSLQRITPPLSGSEAEWNRKAEAALGLLTGKLNAAAYEAVVKPPLE
ncbi:hypothetical protein ACFTAO_35020 [Paenibacillus rhizoplanae]